MSPGVWTEEISGSQPKRDTQGVPNALIIAAVTVVVRATVGLGRSSDRGPVGSGGGTACVGCILQQ